MYVIISSLFLFSFYGSCFCSGVQFVIENMTVTQDMCSKGYFMYMNSEIFGAEMQRSYGMPYQFWSNTGYCLCSARCSNPITDWNKVNFVDYMTQVHCRGANPTGCTDWMNHGRNESYSPFANYINTNTMTVFGDDHLFWLINTLVMQQSGGALYYAFVMANCSTVVNENIIPFNESFHSFNGGNFGVSIAGHYKCLQPTTTTTQTTLTSTSSTSTIGLTSTERTSQSPDSNDKSNIGLKVGLVVLGVIACLMTFSTGYLFHIMKINNRKVAALEKQIPPQPGTSDATGDYEFRTWS